MSEKIFSAIAYLRKIGIVVSIILILLGICMFINPFESGAFFVWCIIIGVLIHGVQKIIYFTKMQKGARDGVLLASGILMVLVCVVLIADVFNAKFIAFANMEACIAVMLGFICIFSGVGKICVSGNLRAVGGSATASILCGVIEILCGLLVLAAPLTGFISLTVVFGVYLLIMGITLLIKSLSMRTV